MSWRYGGPGVELIVENLNVWAIALWLDEIPLEHWPQQNRLPDGKLRPAMVTDLDWRGFGARTDALVEKILRMGPEARAESYQRMLSVVMPGHGIDPHADRQEERWRYRVHVPIATSAAARFCLGGVDYRMRKGSAYMVNTEVEHEVFNYGDAPRIHLMFDVRVA